ncbi:MAG: cytochrome b [Roseibium sp.]|uniref:cytochrome b n=1 Tax=Roseibium sp. TaxID=1936156 RepID=UPI002603AA25|nr:cytochrome b [Roseibium sp.]MCV0426846.1 cytochrome b [Roseibium sp.]
MSKANNLDTYDAVSRLNHWIVAIAMIGMLGFGLYLENSGLDRRTLFPLLQIHKALGVLVLIYGTWRVGYRLMQGFPAPLGNISAWQEVAAKAVHWILLASIIVMPLSGLVMSLAGGHDVGVFGLFTISSQGEFPAINSAASVAHGLGGKILLFTIVLHILGALKHRIIDRDATLSRMVTGSAD